MSAIHSRAMLVSLTITAISARKHDRRISEEVNQQHGADRDAGRFHRVIFAPESINPVISIRNAARARHYELTLPWLHEGANILSAAGYVNYTETMQKFRSDYEAARDSFLDEYEDHKEKARAKLNGMFNPLDYPPREHVRGKFSFHVAISPVPDARDFRVDVGDAEAAAIRRDIEARADEALRGATRSVAERISERVGHMAERLSTYKSAAETGDKATGKLYETMVGNVRDLVELLPTLNIANDPVISSITERMRRDLCENDVDVLKRHPDVRNAVAKAAESILADVGAFLA